MGTRFVINKKYRLKQDLADSTLGKIPQGITATLIYSAGGSCPQSLFMHFETDLDQVWVPQQGNRMYRIFPNRILVFYS